MLRYDSAHNIGTVEKTDEGYLLITAPIARVGIYKYRMMDGSTLKEYVSAETLFDAESIETLKMKPVTNGHPKDAVDPESFKEVVVGNVGETVFEQDGFLWAKFLITDSEAISAIESGRRQLSPAYACEVVHRKGKCDEGDYDAVQMARRYNHLALVDTARGGANLAINMDSAIEITDDVSITKRKDCGMDKPTPTIHIDGVDHPVDNPAVVAHISTLTTKYDGLTTENATLRAQCDAKDLEIKTLKDFNADSVIADRVNARFALIESAKKVLGSDFNADGKDDLTIMTESIKKINPSFNADSEPEATRPTFVSAYFKATCDGVVKLADSQNRKDASDMPNCDGCSGGKKKDGGRNLENRYKEEKGAK